MNIFDFNSDLIAELVLDILNEIRDAEFYGHQTIRIRDLRINNTFPFSEWVLKLLLDQGLIKGMSKESNSNKEGYTFLVRRLNDKKI